MPEPVLDAIDSYDEALRKRDVIARNRLLFAYRRGWLGVLEEAHRLRDAVATAPKIAIIRGDGTVGEGLPPSWTFQNERYQRIQAEIRSLMQGVAGELGSVVQEGQASAWSVGVAEARRAGLALGEVAPSSWASPPRAAFQAFTGGAEGGPLAGLLDSFLTQNGARAGAYARDVLGSGLLAGRSPMQLARELEAGLQTLSYSRALRIARTETLRAYREGARRSYMANPHIVQSWAWRAAVENTDRPPCAACFAKHGSIYPIAESMQTHPNCRCRMVPRRSPLNGVLPNDPTLLDREEAFARLSPAKQRGILGPSRLDGWRRGTWKLGDFATSRGRGPWGRNDATVRPLYELRNLSKTPGRTLGFASNRLFMQAAGAENRVSATLQDVAYRTGGSLEGFGFRLKTTDRIAEKIQTDILDGRGGVTAVSEGINDALRYTIRFSPEAYTDGVRIALDELRARGGSIVTTKNYWNKVYTVAEDGSDSGYRGFHAILRDATGARYELQFHTAESLATKDPSHVLYERQRTSRDPAVRKSIQAEIGNLWRRLLFPPRVGDLG